MNGCAGCGGCKQPNNVTGWRFWISWTCVYVLPLTAFLLTLGLFPGSDLHKLVAAIIALAIGYLPAVIVEKMIR